MHFLPSTSLGLLGNSDWYICESCSTKGIMYVNHLVKQSLIEWVHHGIINNCELFSFFQNNESLDDFSRHTFTLHSIPTPNNNVSFSNWNFKRKNGLIYMVAQSKILYNNMLQRPSERGSKAMFSKLFGSKIRAPSFEAAENGHDDGGKVTKTCCH
jgi:hypothetical protein